MKPGERVDRLLCEEGRTRGIALLPGAAAREAQHPRDAADIASLAMDTDGILRGLPGEGEIEQVVRLRERLQRLA